MNKSDFSLEGLGGGGGKTSLSLSTLRKWGGESQMAPGPFAAEEVTSTKSLPSLSYPLFLLDI